jgi:hypothetical protein
VRKLHELSDSKETPQIVIDAKEIPVVISDARSYWMGEIRRDGYCRDRSFIIASPAMLDDFDYHMVIDDKGFLVVVPVKKKKF